MEKVSNAAFKGRKAFFERLEYEESLSRISVIRA